MQVTAEEIKILNPGVSACLSLIPPYEDERPETILARHYAALKVLSSFDDSGGKWTEEMTKAILEASGIITLIYYVGTRNPNQEWQKKQACQILGMIAEVNDSTLTREVILVRIILYFL